MKRKITIGGILFGALAVMIVLGVSTFQAINAAASTSTQTDDSTPELYPGKAGRDEILAGVTDEYLAEALGISTDELDAAYQAAWEAGLEQAVAEDLITQTQADELLGHNKSRLLDGRSNGWLAEHGIDFKALLANELGISLDELEAAYETARIARIDQAVADGKLTEEQASLIKGRYALFNNQKFQDSMQSAYEAAIQQAVEDGVISQEQAEQLLAETPVWELGGRHSLRFPGMRGGMEGMRSRHPFGDFPIDGFEDTETP